MRRLFQFKSAVYPIPALEGPMALGECDKLLQEKLCFPILISRFIYFVPGVSAFVPSPRGGRSKKLLREQQTRHSPKKHSIQKNNKIPTTHFLLTIFKHSLPIFHVLSFSISFLRERFLRSISQKKHTQENKKQNCDV